MTTETQPVTLGAEVPFYLSRDGEVYGPYVVAEIQGLFDSAVISADDLIWMEGFAEWQPLGTVFALQDEEEAAPGIERPVASAIPASTAVGSQAVLDGSGEPPPVARVTHERFSRRLILGIAAAVIAHTGLLLIAMLAAPSLFKINAYPPIAAPPQPPPLEVAFVPEEQPPPPVPTPPQETAPPPPLEPPPPPAPPIISMPTPPPPPMAALNMPAPPPITDLPISPTPPQHVTTQPRRAVAKATPSVPREAAPSTPQVRDAGPTDYLDAPPPDYPFDQRKRHQGGTVIIRAVIDEGGSPTEASIERSSGYSVLDQSALSDVRDNYRFKVGNARILRIPITFVPPR